MDLPERGHNIHLMSGVEQGREQEQEFEVGRREQSSLRVAMAEETARIEKHLSGSIET